MQKSYQTNRLILSELTFNDAEFIKELVNTAEWIKFIGERNVKTAADAKAYIQKLIDNPNINYWVVKLQKDNTPVGIITFIKRAYLEHHDIGFAFLPKHAKQGFAYEAAVAVLNDVLKNADHSTVFATTIPENKSSIALLEKLGLNLNGEIEHDGDRLLLYGITADKSEIDNLVTSFFSIFTNTNQQLPDWDLIQKLCLPETLIIKKNGLTETVYSLHSFIEPRKEILSNGTLTDFKERQIKEETKITGNIAQRFCRYQKSGYLNGNYFNEYGNKFFQFIKTTNGWKISALIWEDDENI
jgi:RimJ/RimL family protein N-acetyltransferase